MASFEGAPWTRLAFVGSAVGSLLFSSQLKHELQFDLGRVLAQGEIWRFATRYAAFSTVGETIVGLISLYRFRRLERMLGPRKFGVFVLVCCGVSTALETALFVLFARRDEGLSLRPSSGPYALVFGLVALYYHLVPSVEPKLIGLMGLDLSDKSLMYGLTLQLLLSQGVSSVIAGGCGFVAGSLYLSDALGLSSYAFPKWFSSSTDNSRRPTGQQQAPVRPRAVPAAPAPPPAAPSEGNVESLVAMGFDRDRAVAALTSTNDSLEVAANRLLSS